MTPVSRRLGSRVLVTTNSRSLQVVEHTPFEHLLLLHVLLFGILHGLGQVVGQIPHLLDEDGNALVVQRAHCLISLVQ